MAHFSPGAGGPVFTRRRQEPRRWAWHAYKDGEDTYARSTDANPDYARYWLRTRGFLRATAGRSVWLTEQGVVRFRNGVELAANSTPVANAIMRLYVDDTRALTELDPRINMFLYYQFRGDSFGPNRFDSGLVNPTNNARRDVYCIYRSKTNASAPAC